jgi:hypothetical protein
MRYRQKGYWYHDIPKAHRNTLLYNDVDAGTYADWGGNARAQTGWRDPATLAASAVAGARIGWTAIRQTPAVLSWIARTTGLACADGDCGNELRQANESGSRVVDFARSLQGSGNYPGVDQYMQVTLKQGTIVYGGAPGQSHFYTTADAVEKTGRSASRLFQGLQVAPHPIFSYRPGVTAYEVTEDVVVAFGRALANPQHGQGGLPQIVIENYERFLRPVYSIPLLP